MLRVGDREGIASRTIVCTGSMEPAGSMLRNGSMLPHAEARSIAQTQCPSGRFELWQPKRLVDRTSGVPE